MPIIIIIGFLIVSLIRYLILILHVMNNKFIHQILFQSQEIESSSHFD